MKRSFGFVAAFILSSTLFLASPALPHVLDKVWERANYEAHGFSMLMPSNPYVATFESEFEDGWLTLRANMEGAFFLGLLNKGVEAGPVELDALRAKLTELPEMTWETIAEDEDTAGWKWHRTFRASALGDSFFGGYGVGAKGSFVFLVKTSDADFAIHQVDYTKWFESITLDE